MPSADAGDRTRAAERAAFHLGPRDALAVTGPALRSADAVDDPSGAGGLLSWCHAVGLGAAGEYGSAFDVLDRAPTEGPAWARLASLRGSLLRQLGRHSEAQVLDETVAADVSAEPVGRADAAIGLVADAIGVADVGAATAALDRADQLLATPTGRSATPTDHGWRLAVRREWVAAELALLVEHPAQAGSHAARAAQLAEDGKAARHLAKSWLLMGLATRDAVAVRRCLDWSRACGCGSLRWPAALVLAHLPGADRAAGADSAVLLAEAPAGVRAIADGLATSDRSAWLARPEVAALLAGEGGATARRG